MKIAYVCADQGIPLLGTKGASVHVRAITSGLAARGHEVHVLCARLGDGNPPPAVASVRLCETDGDIQGALCELAEDACLDVVLERYSLDSGAARRASTRVGVPLVLEVNAPLVLEAARWRGLTDVTAHLARERDVFETADAIVVVSRALAEYVKGSLCQTSTHWVPNGAAIDRIAAATAEPSRHEGAKSATVIGFTGSMKRWHGLHELLDAFAAVHEMHPDGVLVLCGSGPEEQSLREHVNRNRQLRECVRLMDALPHDDVPALLATFDIGVAPYLATRDFYFSPLKVVEYLAAGLPVVHPRLGDMCEVVADAGIAYDPNDGSALAAALAEMLGDPLRRRQCAAAARERARWFSWEAAAAGVEDVLRAVTTAASVENSE
jgi:glycosyltransferase involved in cell wall biosynthesis